MHSVLKLPKHSYTLYILKCFQIKCKHKYLYYAYNIFMLTIWCNQSNIVPPPPPPPPRSGFDFHFEVCFCFHLCCCDSLWRLFLYKCGMFLFLMLWYLFFVLGTMSGDCYLICFSLFFYVPDYQIYRNNSTLNMSAYCTESVNFESDNSVVVPNL